MLVCEVEMLDEQDDSSPEACLCGCKHPYEWV